MAPPDCYAVAFKRRVLQGRRQRAPAKAEQMAAATAALGSWWATASCPTRQPKFKQLSHLCQVVQPALQQGVRRPQRIGRRLWPRLVPAGQGSGRLLSRAPLGRASPQTEMHCIACIWHNTAAPVKGAAVGALAVSPQRKVPHLRKEALLDGSVGRATVHPCWHACAKHSSISQIPPHFSICGGRHSAAPGR